MPQTSDVTVYSPPSSAVSGSQLTAFIKFCEAETGLTFPDYAHFDEFSVAEFRPFWMLFLRWSELLRQGSPIPACTPEDSCERAVFFPNLTVSYVDNLLRIDGPDDTDRAAVIACHASRPPDRLTRGELRVRVLTLAGALKELGVTEGDHVVAVAWNNAETIVAGLATAAIGANFSTAAPEMGALSILSRFEQLRPTALLANFAHDGAPAPTALGDRVLEVIGGLPTLIAVVALDDGPIPLGTRVPIHRLSDLLTPSGTGQVERQFALFPFNHPLVTLFSSGTTGRPKCIVHGAGGTLLEHVKEHRLHLDLRAGDRLLFQTSAAWMMWNWQLSALASDAAIVLYDGPITGPDTLWRLVAAERVTVFGTSPPYLRLCQDSGYSPRRNLALPALRAVLSTGSILHDRQYDWVRDQVGAVPL